jgi:hypothetical protein
MTRIRGCWPSGLARSGAAAAIVSGTLVTVTLLASVLLGSTALGGTAIASTMLAGAGLATAVLTAALSCIASAAALAETTAGQLVQRRARALREKASRAAFLRITDPDAPGRARPRAPSAAWRPPAC